MSNYQNCNFPPFHEKLEMYFPGALPLAKYIEQTFQDMSQYGFQTDNTLGVIATCRDEITLPFVNEAIKYWGKTFDFSSLGGFVLAGKTGIAALLSHTPMVNNIGRFVFYAMPHIAISRHGQIGSVRRAGIEKLTHACGSLMSIIQELESGHINFQIDPDDVEQGKIRQKILSNIHYGEILDQIKITKLASQIIQDDLKRILTVVDSSIYHYGVFTGILIHGPLDTDWIYPQNQYVVMNNVSSLSMNVGLSTLSR